MKLLAIDTSTKYLSLAIADKNKILRTFHESQDTKHSSLLIPAIDQLLKKCGLKLKNVDTIVLSIGPGSFTGLRIGVATCKGINLALGIPIVAIPTLDVIAYNFIDINETMLCPVIDAKKQKVYSCFYRGVERLTDYMLTDVESLLEKIDGPAVLFGDGAMLYADDLKKNEFVRISTKDWFPKADVVARLGLRKVLKRQFANPDKLVPMYLHSKYCQVKTVTCDP